MAFQFSFSLLWCCGMGTANQLFRSFPMTLSFSLSLSLNEKIQTKQKYRGSKMLNVTVTWYTYGYMCHSCSFLLVVVFVMSCGMCILYICECMQMFKFVQIRKKKLFFALYIVLKGEYSTTLNFLPFQQSLYLFTYTVCVGCIHSVYVCSFIHGLL